MFLKKYAKAVVLASLSFSLLSNLALSLADRELPRIGTLLDWFGFALIISAVLALVPALAANLLFARFGLNGRIYAGLAGLMAGAMGAGFFMLYLWNIFPPADEAPLEPIVIAFIGCCLISGFLGGYAFGSPVDRNRISSLLR